MEEVWLPIKYGDGKKEISSFGRVRSATTRKVLLDCTDKAGYRRITFWVEGRQKSFKIHRLVAEHFLSPVNHKTHVNHIDFNKNNNKVSNLEWCTSKENIQHYFKNKFNSIVSDEDVLFIRQNIESMGAVLVGRKLNISAGYVLRIANGTYRTDVHSELIRGKKPSAPKVVCEVDLDGNVIRVYKSIGAAAKFNNTSLSKVQKVLYGERKSHHGKRYSYA